MSQSGPESSFFIIMYIEIREKNSTYYVIFKHDGEKGKPLAQFASKDRSEAENVAKAYAKQNRCMIRHTSGGIDTPDMPQPPTGEA